MKDRINDSQIESALNSLNLNESASLSYIEKQNVLNSVFERAENGINKESLKTPFYSYTDYFVQYLKYSIPVILLAVISTQLFNIFTHRSQLAISDINQARETLNDMKRESSIKANLSKNREDIQAIKQTIALNDSVKREVLVNQVSNRSKEIRNQVAALVSENKLTEARKIALDLETALKSNELYAVSTSVEQEVFEAIDLRVDIEKKEYNAISSSTESDISKRIEDSKKEIDGFKDNASTTEMVIDAKKALDNADKYAKDKDLSNAIISLQLYDRIVAELKLILIP